MCFNQIDEYFKAHICGFIFNDIEKCIKAEANYTVALALVSYSIYDMFSWQGRKKSSLPNFESV